MKPLKLNKLLLGKIARWLEAGAPEVSELDLRGFDMNNWRYTVDQNGRRWYSKEDGPKCGTQCCIAGAAVQFDNPKARVPEGHPIANRATKLLGMTDDAAAVLFTPNGFTETTGVEALRDVDTAWAARVIRKLIKTGEVDWYGTRRAS
jgi:hypothetical protein